MLAVAIGLALASAAFHVTWNVLLKMRGDPLTTFGLATIAAAAAASVALALGWAVLRPPSLSGAAVALCFVSATLETVYLWLLSAAYRRGEISVAYPIARGTAPLIAVAAGLLVLGERLAPIQLAGVGLLLAGILAVTISQSGGRATLPALLTGVAIAAYTSVDRVGVQLMAPWAYAWLLFVLMAVELRVSLWIGNRLHFAPRLESPGWPRAALIGVSMWLGYSLVLWALSLAPLAVIAPLRETSVVAVAIWGVWRLRERERATLKLSGAVATLAGVALLAV